MASDFLYVSFSPKALISGAIPFPVDEKLTIQATRESSVHDSYNNDYVKQNSSYYRGCVTILHNRQDTAMQFDPHPKTTDDILIKLLSRSKLLGMLAV